LHFTPILTFVFPYLFSPKSRKEEIYDDVNDGKLSFRRRRLPVPNIASIILEIDQWVTRDIKDVRICCVIGLPGTGKHYLYKQFIQNFMKEQPSVNIIWLDTRTESSLLDNLQNLNSYSCELNQCCKTPIDHQTRLLHSQLLSKERKFNLIVLSLNFTDSLDFIRTLYQLNCSLFTKIQICILASAHESMSHVNTDTKQFLGEEADKLFFIVPPLTSGECESIIKIGINCEELQLLERLGHLAGCKQLLLNMATGLISMEGKIYGNWIGKYYDEVKEENRNRGFRNELAPSRHARQYSIVYKTVNYLLERQQFGLFALELLLLTLCLKVWLPIEILMKIRFTPSAYEKSNIVKDKNVS